MSKRSKDKKRTNKGAAKRLSPQERQASAEKRERELDRSLRDSYERLQRGQFEKAEAIIRRALGKLGREPQLLGNLVSALENQGRTEEALRAAEAAVETKPDDPKSQNNLGAVLKFNGRFEEASEHFRRAVELEPNYPDAWRNLAGLKRYTSADDPDLAAMEDLLGRLQRGHDGRTALYFALGRAYDEIGDVERAFDCWEKGNRAKRAKVQFGLADLERLIDQTIAVQTPELLGRGPAAGAVHDAPILIVGMPRSGSTLVEQILASHPSVAGVGEVSDLPRSLESHIEDPMDRMRELAELDDSGVAAIGKAYALALSRREPRARRIVDKYLTNFLHLGTVRRALPNARFVQVTRDPMDNGFGCFKTLFTSNVPFVYDLAEIGGTLRAIERLMDHWKSAMPEAITTVSYEALVGDQEGETRTLLDFLGLPWDDACLRFHETDRRVNSASSTQVRKPLYRSAIASWKPYAGHLGPLAKALDIELT